MIGEVEEPSRDGYARIAMAVILHAIWDVLRFPRRVRSRDPRVATESFLYFASAFRFLESRYCHLLLSALDDFLFHRCEQLNLALEVSFPAGTPSRDWIESEACEQALEAFLFGPHDPRTLNVPAMVPEEVLEDAQIRARALSPRLRKIAPGRLLASLEIGDYF